jgi:hypothetical protein
MAIDPKLTLEQLKKLRDDAFTQKSLFEQALISSPSVDFVTFNNKKYSYADALVEIDRLNGVASEYQKAYDNKKPKPKVDNTLQQSALTQDLETAQRLAGEAFSTLTREITVSPSTSKPFKERYNAALQNLSRAENAAIKGGLDVAKTTTATIAEPTTAAPSTMRGAEALAGEKQTVTGTQDPATTVKSKVIVVKNGNNVEVTTYMDGRISEKVLGPSTLPDTAARNLPKDTSGKPAAMKTYVDEQLKAKGLADTPANRKTLRSEYQALQTTAAATDNSWEQIFIQNNPAKAWYLTDLDRNKYPQLFAVLKQYTLPRPLTVEEQAAFAAKLDGTDFFQELSTSGKVREIKNVVGELGFDSTDFTKFVHTAINMGYTGDRLKQETYKEVFKTGADGKYVNPTALARASKSADYLNVVNTARSYFNTAGANQASVQSVLTGGITTEDFQRQQREIAKKRYPHLADLIDQGVSLESLAGNFQTTAAKLLEVDPNTIDMSAADYEVALNFGEEGKKRVMTTGEWDKLLRTDSRYGWEKTNNAKQEARGLAANLVQAFGRII